MRKKIIAGNWKMYKDLTESAHLVNSLKDRAKEYPAGVSVVVCPPFTSLSTVGGLLKTTPLRLGAQNMSEHDDGAFTGEISWKMLLATGCEYVILGHSERRQYFKETNELVNLKAKKALAHGLSPIICVGETLDEREAGVTDQVITTQIKGVLNGLTTTDMGRVVIAYEPVWAIGTGKNATPQQAQDVHKHIRGLVKAQFDPTVADRLVIQYGGSVKPENAKELLAQPDIDGALVGGAGLNPDSFTAIIRSVP